MKASAPCSRAMPRRVARQHTTRAASSPAAVHAVAKRADRTSLPLISTIADAVAIEVSFDRGCRWHRVVLRRVYRMGARDSFLGKKEKQRSIRERV